MAAAAVVLQPFESIITETRIGTEECLLPPSQHRFTFCDIASADKNRGVLQILQGRE